MTGRCEASTATGTRCRRVAVRDGCCAQHAQPARLTLLPAPPPEPFTPRLPAELQIVKDVAVDHADQLRQVLIDGLTASKPIVVIDSHGRGTLEFAPDHEQRLRTVREILDRLYGRPHTSVHADVQTRTLNVNLPLEDPGVRDAITQLLRHRPAAGNQ